MLIGIDGDRDTAELAAYKAIVEKERISGDLVKAFENSLLHKKEREIYQTGIDLISCCTLEEKLKTFALLYRMSEVDGRVHVKEIKLLLYSIKTAGLEFEDVVRAAKGGQTYI